MVSASFVIIYLGKARVTNAGRNRQTIPRGLDKNESASSFPNLSVSVPDENLLGAL